MSVFSLPHNSSDDTQKMMNSFWWDSERGRRRTHWAFWERLYVLKKYGDMGFHKLYCFNLALGNQKYDGLEAKFMSADRFVHYVDERMVHTSQSIRHPVIVKGDACWCKPTNEMVKYNVGGAIFVDSGYMG
ncbi:hypothetical protein J1N35_042705 [Gossypium stocksii]|uniref:Uncharacterized protein n=1 Tax=Gossypium stocksii TaxID=47602 RepID=A0A9D3ZEF1_9ROSI|nr:hypothetical protein J1N35_042705 [Gossypium stocksii]